jgi:hypothetical protein
MKRTFSQVEAKLMVVKPEAEVQVKVQRRSLKKLFLAKVVPHW